MTEHARALAQPMVALLIWTALIWVWMYATRLPAMRRANIDVANLQGGTGADLEKVLPREVQWKAHNYNHLLEQPVLFYAAVLLLILLGCDSAWSVRLAWAYVGLRIVHSLVQATINRVALRFALFVLASLALFGLIGLAATMTF